MCTCRAHILSTAQWAEIVSPAPFARGIYPEQNSFVFEVDPKKNPKRARRLVVGDYVGRVVNAHNGSKVLVHFLDAKEPENITKSKLRHAGTIGSFYDHGAVSYKLLKFVDGFVHTQRKKILLDGDGEEGSGGEERSDRSAAGDDEESSGKEGSGGEEGSDSEGGSNDPDYVDVNAETSDDENDVATRAHKVTCVYMLVVTCVYMVM